MNVELPPKTCATTEQIICMKPASPVMKAASDTTGFAWTSGKLTDLKA